MRFASTNSPITCLELKSATTSASLDAVPRGFVDFPNNVQRRDKKFANFVKQQPGMGRQKS